MKVCVIGDIHGTNKFIECYNDILKNDNDCDKIIVCGDHFDPYEQISVKEMIDKYTKFINICDNDKRIISLFGNHDLSKYVIRGDETSRTEFGEECRSISKTINKYLDRHYLMYIIGDYIFSHAGVSSEWIKRITEYSPDCYAKLMSNQNNWTVNELSFAASYSTYDYSGYGNSPYQGCTWIRPQSLVNYPFEMYNQVVAHTQVEDITSVEMSNGKVLWLVDNQRKSKYLVLDIKE